VAKTFEKKSDEELRPDDEFVDVNVRQMVKLLEAWKWTAKPLQPAKGNLQGQAWTVGASEPPPNKVMPGFGHDVLITLQK